MASDSIFIQSFAFSGYRSFGTEIQRFERLGKVNLFIGRNNCGKSNVLRFLHDIYPSLRKGQNVKLAPLDSHKPDSAPFRFELARSLQTDETGNYTDFYRDISPRLGEKGQHKPLSAALIQAFKKKAELDNTVDVWFTFGPDGQPFVMNWDKAFSDTTDNVLHEIWNKLAGMRGGSRVSQWIPQTINFLAPNISAQPIRMIPAIRKVGAEESSINDDFSGLGIIHKLARIQNPNVDKRTDRQKFDAVNSFLQSVTDNDTAEIEIPHDRNTILVHMDGKTLPLERLGTGIHEVIILASAATYLENSVICVEEPELHLNPVLQKKLIRYLSNSTNNQYFITTHSASLMDAPNVKIFHLRMDDGETKVSNIISDNSKVSVCEDLGYHPSDLLQANCVIWVEGPSDRLYLNYWLKSISDRFFEGIHYSIMFYGGRLASHLTGRDHYDTVEDFISLRRLNRRGVIVIDSDKETSRGAINDTKKRLRAEFNEGPGFTWITAGREIENYIPESQIREAISNVIPSASIVGSFDRYDKPLRIKSRGGKLQQASKVEVARYITSHFEPDFALYDLKKQITALIRFIAESNPKIDYDSTT